MLLYLPATHMTLLALLSLSFLSFISASPFSSPSAPPTVRNAQPAQPQAPVLGARYLVWDGQDSVIHLGPNTRGREGHSFVGVGEEGWKYPGAEGRFTYDSGPKDFVVQSTVGVKETALCTLEGSSKPKQGEEALAGFTIYTHPDGRLALNTCGCLKGFRVTCTVEGRGGGVDCTGWGGAGQACP